MWWLAAGFFLVTGPGEAYINNVCRAASFIPNILQRNYILTLVCFTGRHRSSYIDTPFLSLRCFSSRRPAINARHNNRPNIHRRPTPLWLSHRPLRTHKHLNPPAIAAPPILGLFLPTIPPALHTLPPRDSSPLRPHPLLGLPPARQPPPTRPPSVIPRNHRPSGLRVRCLLLARPTNHLSSLGCRELRHELGDRGDGPGIWCGSVGCGVLVGL